MTLRNETDAALSDVPINLFSSRRSRLFVGRRGIVASTLSTLLIVAVIVGLLYIPKGGATVRFTFFNPHYLWLSFVGDPSRGIDAIRDGLLTNIWMFLVSEVLVLFFGLLIAWCRISQSPVLFPFREFWPQPSPIFFVEFPFCWLFSWWAMDCLSCSSASSPISPRPSTAWWHDPRLQRVRLRSDSCGDSRFPLVSFTPLVRSAFLRPPPCDMSSCPREIRNVIPPLLNDFISLQKDTALVSVLGAVESVRAAQIFAATDFNESGLVVAALFFLVLTIPMTRLTDRLVSRDRGRRLAMIV